MEENDKSETNATDVKQEEILPKIETPSAEENVPPVTEIPSKSLDEVPVVPDEEECIPNVAIETPKEQPAPPASVGTSVARKKRPSVATGDALAELKLKRRKINVAGAPKMPLTGYVRFMNDRREQLRREMPNKTSLEHTKIIGEEWTQLPAERKAPYLEAAAVDKQRYLDELNKFLKEHPEILASELAKNKTQAKKGAGNTKDKLNPTETNATVTSITCNAGANVSASASSNNENNSTATIASSNNNKSTDTVKAPQSTITVPEVKCVITAIEPDEVPLVASVRPTKSKRTPTPTTASTMTTTTITTATTWATAPIANNGNNGSYGHSNGTNGSSFSVNGANSTASTTTTISQPTFTYGEIPIFTTEFLDHNRNLDLDFRTLRKQRAELEQQNAVLDKHVENTSAGLAKINQEIGELSVEIRTLRLYLGQLKQKLIGAFGNLPLPSEPDGANVDNFDKYIKDLHELATSNTHGPALNKARDIIRKLDLPMRGKF